MFSGGRGSSALTRQLAQDPDVHLQILINGYDDGLSTGEVRYYLGNCLGPSDFRKNASRLAEALGSCPAELISILDYRFPDPASNELVGAVLQTLCNLEAQHDDNFFKQVQQNFHNLEPAHRLAIAERLKPFVDRGQDNFNFNDCSLGNLVFAGGFLRCNQDFNTTVADYCDMLGLPTGLILNVTNGENGFLVALEKSGQFLSSEAEIVNSDNPSQIEDIFLINEPAIHNPEKETLFQAATLEKYLNEHDCPVSLSSEAGDAISHADLIIYAPGTQYSSLLPSYMTPELGLCVASNLTARKMLITNIHEDAETQDASAVDIIEQALFYLREKNKHQFPAPLLITHYLVNTPGKVSDESLYMQPGQIESIEDPRLIRIGNYEEGITGKHQPEKLLAPFITAILKSRRRFQVAVLLMDTVSLNKTTQTLLEMVRAQTFNLDSDITIYYCGEHNKHVAENPDLKLKVRCVQTENILPNDALVKQALDDEMDFLCLCESSGMYHGHDIVALLSNLNQDPVDGVWGSRRLSVHDIQSSYKFRYNRKRLKGMVSYFGSHLLSLTYLLLYGRYISDTLSGLRLLRADFFHDMPVSADDACFNQHLLSRLLKGKGKVFEVPVEFLPMSPEKVKRTTVNIGLRSLMVIIKQRFNSQEANGRINKRAVEDSAR